MKKGGGGLLAEKEMNEIMDTYSGYLLQLSYLCVKNWATAEDIVQESFIKYFRHHKQFKGEASLKTYLGRITIHFLAMTSYEAGRGKVRCSHNSYSAKHPLMKK